MSTGKTIRLGKFIDPEDGRSVVVAADHGFMLGSIKGVIDLESTLKKVVAGGPDAVLMSVGQAARLNHLFQGRKAPALLIRADWTNAFRDRTYTLPARSIQRVAVAGAEDAVALGASGIVTYFFIGYGEDEKESRDYELMTAFSKQCSRLGLPFIVEPLPMGERVTGANYADLITASIRMAVEAGADAIKAPYSGDPETFRKAVRAAGNVPVLILGGAKAKTIRDALEVVAEALSAGAAGVVFGRQVVQAENPAKFVESIKAVVHEGKPVREVVGWAWKGPLGLKVNADKCTGCLICTVACSFKHHKVFTKAKARLRIEIREPSSFRPIVCTHCMKCVEACPKHALRLNAQVSCVQVIPDRCDGCGVCVEACPLHVVGFDDERKQPLICDMCERLPECVEWCQPGALEVYERQASAAEG